MSLPRRASRLAATCCACNETWQTAIFNDLHTRFALRRKCFPAESAYCTMGIHSLQRFGNFCRSQVSPSRNEYDISLCHQVSLRRIYLHSGHGAFIQQILFRDILHLNHSRVTCRADRVDVEIRKAEIPAMLNCIRWIGKSNLRFPFSLSVQIADTPCPAASMSSCPVLRNGTFA
jgi:hypothetical protein